MELRQIARVLLRWWWLVLIPTLVAAALTLPGLLSAQADSGGFGAVIHYSAAQVPDALPPRDGDFQDIWLASEYTVNALAAWTLTDGFRQEVARLAGDSVDTGRLGVAADNERSVGQLFLSYPDAAGLQAAIDAAVAVLQTRTADYFPQVGSAPAAVTLLGQPTIAPAPPPLADRFGPLIRVLLGLLGGVALAFLAHYLDPTLRRREDVEALGLPVIAALPRD
jgi:hypothetical protein